MKNPFALSSDIINFSLFCTQSTCGPGRLGRSGRSGRPGSATMPKDINTNPLTTRNQVQRNRATESQTFWGPAPVKFNSKSFTRSLNQPLWAAGLRSFWWTIWLPPSCALKG